MKVKNNEQEKININNFYDYDEFKDFPILNYRIRKCNIEDIKYEFENNNKQQIIYL